MKKTLIISFAFLAACGNSDISDKKNINLSLKQCFVAFSAGSNYNSELLSNVENYLLQNEILRDTNQASYSLFVESIITDGPVISQKDLMKASVTQHFYNVSFTPTAFMEVWQCLCTESFTEEDALLISEFPKSYLASSFAETGIGGDVKNAQLKFLLALQKLPERIFESAMFRSFLLFLLWDKIIVPVKSPY